MAAARRAREATPSKVVEPPAAPDADDVARDPNDSRVEETPPACVLAPEDNTTNPNDATRESDDAPVKENPPAWVAAPRLLLHTGAAKPVPLRSGLWLCMGKSGCLPFCC